MTEGAAVADEVMAALERNGVSFVGLPGKKDAKKEGSGGRGGDCSCRRRCGSTSQRATRGGRRSRCGRSW